MAVPTTLPPITPDLLAEWGTLTAAFIAPFVAAVQGLKGDMCASAARLDQRIDEVREEIQEVRAEIKALENKLDPVLESLLAVKS